MDKAVYIYMNAQGHHHVSLNELTEDEMTLNFYEFKGKMKLNRYLLLMDQTINLITSLKNIRNEIESL